MRCKFPLARSVRWSLSVLTAAGLTVLAVSAAYAQLAGGDFEIRRSTIDAGGDTSSGGVFVLSGTIGQADTARSSAGAFELNAGFWTPASSDLLFKDSYEG